MAESSVLGGISVPFDISNDDNDAFDVLNDCNDFDGSVDSPLTACVIGPIASNESIAKR